jgi:hypothetical protein
VTALGVLAGYDADLAAESTRLTNRLHAALLHVHPALERLLGQHFRRRGVLELLAAAGTPARLRALGEDGLRTAMMARSRRLAVTLPAQILAALDEQTVIVPATEQYGRVISGVAAQLLAVLDQRVTVAGELDALLAEHPLAEVLTSMPGVGRPDRGRAAADPRRRQHLRHRRAPRRLCRTRAGDPPVRSQHPRAVCDPNRPPILLDSHSATWPRSSAGPSGSASSHSVAPPSDGMRSGRVT